MKRKLLFITFLMLFCSTMFGQFTPKYSYTSDGTYDNPMTLSAVIEFDGEEQINPNLELGVFCGDELRGGAFVLERNGRYYARPLIYGQSGQFFTFKVYDHITGIEREWSVGSTFTYGGSTMEYMSYNSNGYGNFSQPAVIDFVTPNYWNPEPFQFNFQVTAVILKDGVEQTDTNLELGAFSVSDGTVRGSVKLYPQTILGNTRYYAYMLVGGTSGEEITFKLYDHGTRQELQFNDVNTCILTEDDDATGNPILGSYIKPFEVNFITAPYVAQIDDANYTSFEAALTAAEDYDEITLLEDVTLAVNPTVVSKDINIKLNGKTVSGTIKLAHTGATVTGVAEAMTVTSGVEGYIVVCENNVYSLDRPASAEVAYRAYVKDETTYEGLGVDLQNVYAEQSLKVELYSGEQLLRSTTYAKDNYPIDADEFTCLIVLDGTADEYWNTTIECSELTVANIPTTIKVYADGTLVHTYNNALGAGTNVDETADYMALDCVYKEAKIGETLYATFAAAYEAAATGNEIILLANVDFAETTVSKDININLNNNTVTGTIVLANTGATVTCAEGAVNVTTSLAGYKVVFEDGMYKLVAKNYVAQVGDVKYESIQEAVDAAQAGNEIVVIAAIDGEDVVVDKNVTISGSVTLNDVSINAVEGASELTVSGLSFTGNSWINSGAASKLTVTGVSANVTPSNTYYTNSRSAFISLGRSEGKQLELIVTDCNIVANGGGNAILGWAAITNATLTGNTFGSETAYQTNSDCVKFMAIADGAVFNITGNTIYSNYNGIVFGQNTTRDNAYTVNVNTNNFYGSADHIWIEVSGSNTTHATIKATSDNKVNGIAFTAKDIKLHPDLNTFTSYAGVDVVLDVNGKVLGGTFKYVADGVIADGYEKADNNDGTYGIIKSISGKISYRAYVNDTETREGLGVDLENIVAKESVVVKLYDANDNPLTTTSLKAGGAEAATLTCNIVLWGDPSSSWETTIHATELTVVNVPDKIELIIDGQVLDTFENALGEGTNVDETEDYKALDCVLDAPVAKVGNTEYYNINNAIANWTAGSTLTLLTDVTLSDVITLKSTEHHILNLDKYTMTAAEGKNAIEITCNAQSSETYALTVKANSETPGGIIAGNKSCIYYKKSDETKDRPIITIENGVFNGGYSINIYSSNRGTNCPTVKIANGTFNGNVNIAHGKLITTGGIFNGWIYCTGDVTAYRLISGGTFKNWQFMTEGPSGVEYKFTVGKTKNVFDCGVYVDDNGYLVVGGDVITEAGTRFKASSNTTINEYTSPYNNYYYYLKYSSAKDNGIYYTSVEEALADNKKESSKVNIYVNTLDLTGTSYKGTLVITNSLTVTFPEGTTPTWKVASGEEDHEVGYTESVANGVVTRVYTLFTPVAKVGEVKYESFEAALNAVQHGETITLLGTTGSEISKEIDFTRAITFTITGTAPNYALPVVTFQNATVNIEDAEILIPELDARQNATINVINSKVYDAGGNSIAKSYYNGAINISGTSEVYMMQVTTMGYINISGTAKLHATWQTNVYGNGLITLNNGATFNTAALHLTAKDYENRDNTDLERVGKPAEIIVDGADFTVGKVYSSNGADYSYNSSHGINIGTIDGKFAILNVKNGGKVNYHMADGETANIGAGGTVNVNASTFKTQCRAENGTVTLANNGTFNVTGAAILAANVIGDGWFYMNSVDMTEATNLNGAKVRFASGTNNIVGSTIDNGFFQVGIGAYHGQDEKVDTENGVVVNVTNNAKIGANADTYAGWLGTGFYDTDAEKLAAMTNAKYVLNIVNSIAEFGYIHVSNDGELNVSGNATVKAWYNNSDYSFYAGDLIINGTAEFDATDVLAIYTKVSCDNGTDNPGTLNINADTEYEAERHNGAIDGINFDIRKTGVVNVAANTNLHIGEYTSIAADATMNIAGEATALGTITNNGAITLTTEAAKLTTPELTTNVPTTNVPEHKVVYENGTYKVVAKVYVAEVNGVKYESLQEAVNVGGEVTILQDFVLTETVTIAADKTVTLDLNGKTISAEATFAVKAIVNNGTLTINGNGGTIDISASTTESIQVVDNYGTLTINGGTYKGATSNFSYAIRANHENSVTNIVGATITTYFGAVGINKGVTTITDGKFEVTSEAGGHALYVANAEVTINGGEFIPYANAYSYAVLTNDANAKVSITGGTFKKGLGDPCVKALSGNIIITGGTFATDVNAYCHANYAAIQGADNLWRVEQVLFDQTTALHQGWNWYSSYVNLSTPDGLEKLQTALGENGVIIKSNINNEFVTYEELPNGDFGWVGNEFSIYNTKMYMIETSNAHEMTVTGEVVDGTGIMFMLEPGWNWIGYPIDKVQNIDVALSGLQDKAQADDMIKHRNDFAYFDASTKKWVGTLTQLEPGKGYKYKSNKSSISMFYYTKSDAKETVVDNAIIDENYWKVESSGYANNMTITAMLSIDGEIVNDNYEIAAFANGECRGSARPIYVESKNAYMLFMTVFGDDVEELTFKYYDIDADTEYELSNVMNYSNDAIVGTIDNPYIFSMNILGIGENSIDNINIYPNPTTTDREINLQAICDKVEVFNALGVKVAEYHNVDTLDAFETAGIYVIRITNDNAVKHCRLVVK